MRALAIVHQVDAGVGVFAPVIEARGTLDEWAIAEDATPPADPLGYGAVLVLGGAVHPDEGEEHPWLAAERSLLAELIEAEVPTLGLCLGAQLVAAGGGAPTRRAARPEIGWHRVEVTDVEDPLLAPLAPSFEAFQWHSFGFGLPPGATELARSEVGLQGCRIGTASWALQFHPEVASADAEDWIAESGSDPDAVAIGLDPAALATETAAKIGAWNELGQGICDRWLDRAEALVKARR